MTKTKKEKRSLAASSFSTTNNNNGGSGAATTTAAAPITTEGSMPQKKFYRSRAHCNPLSFNENFEYPPQPEEMDWTKEHYPDHPMLTEADREIELQEDQMAHIFFDWSSLVGDIRPDVLDVGCGFGGLTLALSESLPNHTILGLEIRPKVAEFVRLRILAQRKDHPTQYQNCSVLRTNAMKYLPNFFAGGSLEKMFICFPDPHFKRKNWPRRIVSERLLTEYAYLLTPTIGRLYVITDVKDLHEWHIAKCNAHPMFRKLTEDEMDADPCVKLMKETTEEGKKVVREGKFGHEMYYGVYERISDEKAIGSVTASSFFDEGQFGVEVIE
jgi:tRNA (guanine-N7-)-methyltransferase